MIQFLGVSFPCRFRRLVLAAVLLRLAASPAAPAVAQASKYTFTTIAGDPSAGSQDGTNGEAHFFAPAAIAIDSSGSLFVADSGNHVIRKLSLVGTNWVSSTIAGLAAHAGSADGTNSGASFNSPVAIAADRTGNLFVADIGSFIIRKITPIGSTWVVSTIAGTPGVWGTTDATNQNTTFSWPTSVGVDSAGDVFVADYHRLRKLSQIGQDWVSSTVGFTNYGFGGVNSVSFDKAGRLYLAGYYTIGNDGDHGVLAGLTQIGTNWIGDNLPAPPDGNRGWFSLAAAENGVFAMGEKNTLWRAIRTNNTYEWSAVAGTAGVCGSADGTNALFDWPRGAAVDDNGNLYVADTGNNTIRKLTPVDTSWVASTVAGRPPTTISLDGTNRDGLYSNPHGIAVAGNGVVYVADMGAHAIRMIQKLGTDWVTRTIAGFLGSAGMADGTNFHSRLNSPSGIAVAPSGLVYVTDTGNNTIRQIMPAGTNWVTCTIAGSPGTTDEQDGTNTDIHLQGPNAIVADAAGNLYVSEYGQANIRHVSRVGTNWISRTITNLSGVFPEALVSTSDGTLFFTGNGALFSLTQDGNARLLTVLDFPYSTPLAMDPGGAFIAYNYLGRQLLKIIQLGTNWINCPIPDYFSSGSIFAPDAGWILADPVGIAATGAGDLFIAVGNTIMLGVRQNLTIPAPVIAGSEHRAGSFSFTWNSFPGCVYQPQVSRDPTSGQWELLGGPLAATNSISSAEDSFATSGQRFYRIVLLP